MRVAIIGAGLTGTITALSLAEAGVKVDLYDRLTAPLLGASGVNEGKIHLGYVYAMDKSFATARMMMQGAAHFRLALEPWVGSTSLDKMVSSPFIYAVPKSTMLDLPEIRNHFVRVSAEVQSLGVDIFQSENMPLRELSKAEAAETFDPDHIQAAFQTNEIAIDVLAVRQKLLSALAAAPNVTERYETEALSIAEATSSGYEVSAICSEGAFKDRYDQVVNAAWQQRLRLDATMGIHPPRPAIHRYKCGIRSADPLICRHLPPVTFLVGEYGDTVAYPDGAYASWYPAGLLSQETNVTPSSGDLELCPNEKSRIIVDTFTELKRFMPATANALDPTASDWNVVGGYISAWGTSGIDDKRSELHRRYKVGVHSKGGYHSIDTGKYTLAPLFATQVASRILGR